MTEDCTDDPPLASADTLEGLLQRGRGLGAIGAAVDRERAAPAVYDCVRTEMRWDDQVDHRHLYLARLIEDLELSPAPVVALLGDDEDTTSRATGVLELLALGGCTESRDGLRRYIREGPHWADTLQSVADCWPVEWWDDLADVARARLTDDDDLWADEPWSRWRLNRPAPGWRGRHCPVHDLELTPTSRRLLATLADPGEPASRKAYAVRLLAARGADPALLPLVPSLVSTDGQRPLPSLGRAVSTIGPAALPAAREWAADPESWLSWIGVQVLAAHGEERDIPTLLDELQADWDRGAWCGPDTPAAGLARHGRAAAAAAPLLHRFRRETPHSYERPAYLEALAAVAPHGLDEAWTESLWDCEPAARALGAARAPGTPQVRARLARLRDDPREEPEVRAAAADRLAAD